MQMRQAVIDAITDELEKAEKKFPLWPIDPIHAAAILQEEVGELVRACLQICYEPQKGIHTSDLVGEAAQVGAMAIRFIERIHTYEYRAGEQK